MPINEVVTGTATVQRLNPLTKEAVKKISTNLNNTFLMGVVTGFTGIIGYSCFLKENSGKLLFLAILLAAASYISGFFLGFLFGIPKRNIDQESAYNLSTNLVDISDWLTKIIIGLGLIEIKRIPEYLQAVGLYIQQSTGGDPSIKIFSVCCLIYFSIFGLYYGYNYMRLLLSAHFKEADDNLLQNQRMLSEKGEELSGKDFTPDSLDKSEVKKLQEYEQLLKSTKTENDYTFEDWYYKGIAAYDKGEYNNTIASMRNAIGKDSDAKKAADAYLYIGLAYHKLQLYEKAIEATTKIISNYKDYPYLYLAYANIGVYYENSKKYDKALENYEEAIKLNPTDAQSWYGKAIIYAINKEKEHLFASLEKAIELNSAFKPTAKTESVFADWREDEVFKKLTS